MTAPARKKGRGGSIALAIVVTIALLVVVAFFVVKHQVRVAIEEQCSAALQGSCTIDDLSMSSDGAAAHGIHLQAKLGLASGEIESIAVQLAWWPLVTSERQGMALRVAAPKLSGSLPIGNIVRAARGMAQGVSATNSPSRVRLDALTIERGDVRVSIPIIADAHIDTIAVEWRRGGRFSLQWKDASFENLVDSSHTGECKTTLTKSTEKVTTRAGRSSPASMSTDSRA
jgi:hypothetical protein